MPPALTVGELAEVTIALPPSAPALLLPNASIKRRDDQTGVWRRDGDGLHFVAVRLGAASLDGRVQVLGGLRDGDQVVVYSERDLSERSRIRIVPALTAAAGTAGPP